MKTCGVEQSVFSYDTKAAMFQGVGEIVSKKHGRFLECREAAISRSK